VLDPGDEDFNIDCICRRHFACQNTETARIEG
jgi:hypothetical protein